MNGLTMAMNAQHAHNDYNLQQATNKIPPAWNPSNAKNYSFRMWLVDLQLWEVATDADQIRHGPMVALRLQGAARDMVREMDAQILANGRMQMDGNGNPYQQSGLQYLLQLLTARFAPLPQEVQLEAITELFTWRRQQHDTYDETITRYELMLFRLQNIGNVQLQPPIKTWMLLSALHVPRERWATLLFPTMGLLPQTAQEYAQFLEYLRRQGHLFDGTTDRNVSHRTYFGDDSGAQTSDWTTNSWSGYDRPSPVYATVATAVEEEEDWSSGHSNCDEPIYLSTEISSLPAEQQGEALYLQYRTHKRAFRHFSKSGPRRKGKGKGKGRKGKSNRKPMFYSDGSAVELPEEEETLVYESYYGGKGSGKGKFSGPRKNPRGSDGKIMTCSGCGSEDHFIRFCPKSSGKGKAPAKSGTSASSTFAVLPTSYPGQVDATHEAPTRIYLSTAIPEEAPANSSIIQFADGTSEVAIPASFYENMPRPGTAATQDSSSALKPGRKIWTFEPSGFYPWWHEDAAFHAKVRLPSGEGLLVDCGAVSNLAGDRWLYRQKAIAEAHGQGTSIETLDKPGSVEGVGEGSSRIGHRAGVPICLASGQEAKFETSVVTDSDLPALLGLESLERQGALIDCRNRKLIQVGAGGYKLQLSPNSTSHDLQRAPSGHLLLPCSAWKGRSTASSSGKPALDM